jgi:hypothetical protein
MRHIVVCLLLITALAGCMGADEPVTTPPILEEHDDHEPIVGHQAAANTTDAGVHIHDEWGSATLMTLADMTVDTSDCSENPLMDLFLLGHGLMTRQEVQKGCALFGFDPGHIVHEGTARLHIDIDASNAQVEGGMRFYYGNAEKRFIALEETQDESHTWVIDMEPIEWDLPHSTETEWYFMLQPAGQVAILDGTIDILIEAERIEDWEPILAVAHLDHWNLPERHSFIAPGIIRSLDTNVTVTYGMQGGSPSMEPYPLDDIIPPGSTQVTLAAKWGDVRDCPPGHECWLMAWLGTQSGGFRGFQDPAVSGDDWAIWVYDSPDPLAPDSTYAEESAYSVRAFVRSCPLGEPLPVPIGFFNGCLGEAVATMSTDVRFEVASWKNGIDIAALQARLEL